MKQFIYKIMKNFFKVVSLAVVAAFVLISCQKEEDEFNVNSDVQLSGEPGKIAIINGQQQVYEKEVNKASKKGLVAYEDWLETDVAYTINSSEQYQTIKVYRQPYDPNNFFYIMIENLRYDPNNNGSWVYDNNSANVQKYGRLYDWQTASASGSMIYMRLPRTHRGQTRLVNSYGKLPSIQDIKDLLETTQNIGHLPTNGTDVNGGEEAWDYYYDAFVAGIELNPNYSAAYHSLAGWRDNLDVVPNNQEFNHINQKGQFWLSEGNGVSQDAHYPLSITHTDTPTTYLMTAYINAACADRYGFAVRYVFYQHD